ncbi:MAG: hypothetical protein A2054_01315 [Deltaproteobacteria bacterium GWA2_55_10]|nr:MAG: hypothetical protein A2054_01315 [Deltaproteobacteria bacterium GWA2_55_10]
MKPQNLILRCYAYRTSRGTWVAKCIDLNIAEEENSLLKVKKSLEEAITGYIDAVLDTEDKASIPSLLKRKSPIRDRATYYGIYLMSKVRSIKSRRAFEEAIPFHLSGGSAHC